MYNSLTLFNSLFFFVLPSIFIFSYKQGMLNCKPVLVKKSVSLGFPIKSEPITMPVSKQTNLYTESIILSLADSQ